MYSNPMNDIYNPGTDLTCRAAADVTGKTFAAIAGAMDGGNLTITTATAGSRIAGVIKYDAAATELVGVARGASRVVTVTAGAAITAGAQVEVGPAGAAIPHTTGEPVGYVVTTADAGADAYVSLYH